MSCVAVAAAVKVSFRTSAVVGEPWHVVQLELSGGSVEQLRAAAFLVRSVAGFRGVPVLSEGLRDAPADPRWWLVLDVLRAPGVLAEVVFEVSSAPEPLTGGAAAA